MVHRQYAYCLLMKSQSENALRSFRAGLYRCLDRWGDALFELCDAALCAPAPVHSVPGLSLEPTFRRGHGSLYKALALGRVDEVALRQVLVEHRPVDWPAVFAVDASVWDRCDAETSPERGFYHSASKHSAGQPIVAGWSYQWITQLDWAPDSWTAPIDARRLTPHENPTTATVDQVHTLVGRLPTDETVPLFVFDAGYDAIALTHDLTNTRAQVLVRIRSDRVFYPDPGPRSTRHRWTTPPSRPPLRPQRRHNLAPTRRPTHHQRLPLRDHHRVRLAWPTPQARTAGTLARPPQPTNRGRDHHPGRGRTPTKTNHPAQENPMALVGAGPGPFDLDLCWRSYLRRFDIEHTYRFVKNTLGWTTPSVSTPEQADRWTWLIIAAYTQLRLARSLVNDIRLPWERPRNPANLTPTRVRRGFHRLRATIDTPARPPKPSRAGPGRPTGTQRPPRTRYPPIKKTAKHPTKV